MAGGSGVTLGFLKFVLGLDGLGFEEGLTDAEQKLKASQKKLSKIGEGFTSVGQSLSLAITAPLLGIAAASIKGAQDQEAAMAQVTSALASMGNVAGRTAEQLGTAADAMEMNSLFDADVILKQVTANLLTFGNVAGAQFDRAQQAALDMATRLGGEPQAAAIMLGKALNDPIRGITALTRVGVQFTDAQKAQIAAMEKAGNTAGAQGIILAEVERQFRGAAAAAAETSPWRQVTVAMGQVSDKIGMALLPLLKPVTDAILRLLDAVNSLSPQAQKFALIAAGIAAALGPAAIAIGTVVSGFSAILPLFTSVAVAGSAPAFLGLGAVGGPLLLIAAGAGAVYLAFKNWEKIGPWIDGFVAEVNTASAQIAAKWKDITDAADEADRRMGMEPKHDFTNSMVQAAIDTAAKWDAFAKRINETSDWVDQQALLPLVAAWDSFARRINTLSDQVDAAVARAFHSAVASAQRLYTGVKTWLQDKLAAVFGWVIDKAKAVGDAFFALYDRVVGHSYIPDMVTEIGQNIGRLTPLMVQPIAAATAQASGSFLALQAGVETPMTELTEQAEAAWVSIARSAMDGARNIVGAIQGGGLLDILGSLLDTFIGLAGAGVFGKTIKGNVQAPSFGGFRAAGGPTVPGKSYVVGENGPEWFTPRARGFVTPGGGGGRGGAPVSFDLRGAVMTADLVAQMGQIAAATGGRMIAANDARGLRGQRQRLA